jgi:hypothetical protein
MQVYFSHSYRDVPINGYFSDLFDKAGIALRADQKTEVWCMAKLERYMFEMDGFVSIITRRLVEDVLTYSPYIGRELMLARRARTPRILFVDDQVLDAYRKEFPASAIPFFRETPEMELTLHVEQIAQFRRLLATGGARPPREYIARQATIVAGQGSMLRDAASRVAAIFRVAGYKPAVIPAATSLDDSFDDIDVFESVLNSELCVFVLDKELSCSDLLLAMVHAHCIPTMRLRHDLDAKNPSPDLSGTVRWKTAGELTSSFEALLQNYKSAFATTSGQEGMQKLATPEEITKLSVWNPNDGPGLVVHVMPDNKYVNDRVDGVSRMLSDGKSGRVDSDMVGRALYDRVQKDRFYYTYEPVLTQSDGQKIRTPEIISSLNCGTCIDFACLFAAMLEAAHEQPVVIVVRTKGGSHAVAGYLTPDAVLGAAPPSLGDVRGAVNRGELVVFETTGAVEAKKGPVGAETVAERKEFDLLLDYQTAKTAAKRLLLQEDIDLIHFVNVQQIRRARRLN